MRELEDALIDALKELRNTRDIAGTIFWCWGDDVTEFQTGRRAAREIAAMYPRCSSDDLLAVSRASGVAPTEAELAGWEQYWIELGLDNQPEVEHTASTGWHQPPLPGLESI